MTALARTQPDAPGTPEMSISSLSISGESTSDDSRSDAGSFVAPMSSRFPDPSIDGTSIGAEDVGMRPTSEEEVTDEDRKRALEFKSQANALFTASKYREALNLYTASINCNPFDYVLWSNRSACRLKLEEFGLAVADATQSIELNSKYVKAYYRRAIANLAVMKCKQAVPDLKKILALEPDNKLAKERLDATQKLIRRMQFEAAISAKDEVSASEKIREQIKNGSTPIESSYKGPMLGENEKITVEFVEALMQHFESGQTVPKRIAWYIILAAYDVLREESTLSTVPVPEGQIVNVIGDTHGQFYDFMYLLSLTGRPSETHTLVFNGDFVDRGSWSTEIALVLFAYKALYPKNLFLNRGNHETSNMNKLYGFEGETKKKYSDLTYQLFEEVFTALPLASLVEATEAADPDDTTGPKNPTLHDGRKRFYVVHGGLFKAPGVTLDQVRKINRMREKQPGQDGLMADMLWSDPQAQMGIGPSNRGLGFSFGEDITRRFTENNEITAVIRSHECRNEGYSVEHSGLCMTIFSAPNYVDQVGNLGAFATIDSQGRLTFTTFKEQPHPDVRPMAYASNFLA